MPKASKVVPETRTAAVSVRVKPSLQLALKAAADDDGRTVAQYVERLLEAHLKDIGKLK